MPAYGSKAYLGHRPSVVKIILCDVSKMAQQSQTIADGLGRIDWRGVILSYVLTAALPPDPARDMFFRAIGAIGHFFGLPSG